MPLFNWTGNPWVDTGLAVMIARAKELKLQVITIQDLTPDIIEQICRSAISGSTEEYSWLTNTNRRLRDCHIITVTTLHVFWANGIIPFSMKWMTLNIERGHYFIRYLLAFWIGIGV